MIKGGKAVDPLEKTIQDLKDRTTSTWAEGAMTPRQAWAVLSVLAYWADTDLRGWLDGDVDQPLYQCEPFVHFDERVMMLVGENKAFAEKARKRCLAVHDEIEQGVLPFDRPGCYFDEVLVGAAVRVAEDYLNDMPELFAGLPERPSADLSVPGAQDEEQEIPHGDDDWDQVTDGFDDLAQWDDWEVPLVTDHPVLGPLLEQRHPFRWFDQVALRPRMTETLAEHLGITESELVERRAEALAGVLQGSLGDLGGGSSN